MIIHIVGTSGSGKSTAVRTVLRGSDLVQRRYLVGRKACYAQEVRLPHVTPRVVIFGHYDSARGGGCDTIHETPALLDAVAADAAKGHHVLYEGLFVMNMTRGPAIARANPGQFHVLRLKTTLEECMAGVAARRAESGRGGGANEAVTRSNMKRAESYCWKMSDAGARVLTVTREDCPGVVLELFKGTKLEVVDER